MLTLTWPFSHGRLLVLLSKVYKNGTFNPHQVLVGQNIMSLPPVCHETNCSDIEGWDRTLGCLYYVPYFSYLFAVLMLTSQSFWGKALITTIHYKSLCLGQWLHINFVFISIRCSSHFRTKLVHRRDVDCSQVGVSEIPVLHSNISSRGSACVKHENATPNTHRQLLLTY